MRCVSFLKWLAVFLISCFLQDSVTSQISHPSKKEGEYSKTGLSSASQVIDQKKLDVNNISSWFTNDGEFYSDHYTGGPGFEWPLHRERSLICQNCLPS